MATYDLSLIKTSTKVCCIDFHREIGSTNDRAIELLKSVAPAIEVEACVQDPTGSPPFDVIPPLEGWPLKTLTQPNRLPLLVLAECQTSGRGQHHRPWAANYGAVTFSLCIDSTDFNWQQGGTVCLGWAVYCAIDRLSQGKLTDLGIKWPNDVLIGDAKLAGILVEKIVPNSDTSWLQGVTAVLVIGIGVNVNNSIQLADIRSSNPATMPKKVAPPISLAQSLGRTVDQTALLIELIQQVESALNRLDTDPSGLMSEVYQKLILRNRNVSLQLPGGETIEGKVAGLGPAGELMINSNGGPVAISSGQVLDWWP